MVRKYGLCAWCHLLYIFRIIQTHAYSHSLAPYTVFRVGRITFFRVNRVKNQNEPKRPQSVDHLGLLWLSNRPSADSGTESNLHHALK